MKDACLFQLGSALETGAQEEDIIHGPGAIIRDRTPEAAPENRIDGALDTMPPAAPPAAPCASDRPSGGVFDVDRDDHFIRRDGIAYAGTHLIIEVIRGEGLDDEARIRQAFRDCVEACGATLLHIHTHKFSPQGVSGVAVLAESHISVHTWPEIGYGAFDVFMCGDAEPRRAIDVLAAAFCPLEIRVRELRRGEGIVPAQPIGAAPDADAQQPAAARGMAA